MATYFHVAHPTYQVWDDLKCFQELEAEGYAPEWKWEGDYIDTDVVCLFESRAEAEVFIDEWLPAGVLLQIEIPDDADDVQFTRVSEGFLAVYGRILAAYIEVAA